MTDSWYVIQDEDGFFITDDERPDPEQIVSGPMTKREAEQALLREINAGE